MYLNNPEGNNQIRLDKFILNSSNQFQINLFNFIIYIQSHILNSVIS